MKRIMLYILGGVVGLLVLVFALIGFISVTRGTPVKRVQAPGDPSGPPSPSDTMFLPTVDLLTGMHLSPGNAIEVMINGDQTYPKVWDDLRSAKRSITLQMYYCAAGADRGHDEGDRDRARACRSAGALPPRRVRLAEPYGRILGRLEERRAWRVATFRPVQWYDLHKAAYRSHIRVVVVDGRVGYTGGFGLDDKWFGDGRHEGSVARLQRALRGARGDAAAGDVRGRMGGGDG